VNNKWLFEAGEGLRLAPAPTGDLLIISDNYKLGISMITI